VDYRQAALGHHLHEIAVTELEEEVRSPAQNDDVPAKVPTLEQFIPTHKRTIALHPFRQRVRKGGGERFAQSPPCELAEVEF
jgi:hypothetical protein